MKSTQTPTPTTLELASDVQRLIDGFASRVDGSTERLNGVLVGAALRVANCAAFDAFATLEAVRDCGDQTVIGAAATNFEQAARTFLAAAAAADKHIRHAVYVTYPSLDLPAVDLLDPAFSAAALAVATLVTQRDA